jgi:hypothetical protein
MADLGAAAAVERLSRIAVRGGGEEKRYPLRAKVCEACKLVQVDYDVAPEELFGNYVYFSSYSDEWLAHAQGATARWRAGASRWIAHSLVVELASNDGYLLKNFVTWASRCSASIRPTRSRGRRRKSACPRWWSSSANPRPELARGPSADLIIGNNVLAHVPLLNDFVAGIAAAAEAQRHVTIEFPHLLS